MADAGEHTRHVLALSFEHEIHELSTGRSELWGWNGKLANVSRKLNSGRTDL